MKTPPPFLVGASLVFWGWQTGFLGIGLILGVIIEAARFTQARWEFSDEDFGRIWTFCTLVFLGAAVFAFTSNNGPAHFSDLINNPRLAAQGRASRAGAQTATSVLRWLPMILFLFITAQTYSSRERIPLTAISFIFRRRWKKSVQRGIPVPSMTPKSIGYAYFAICLFAASIHAAENSSYFWGVAALLTWALWPQRSRRFRFAVWAMTISCAFFFGYLGQRGVGQMQGYLQNIDAHLLAAFMRRAPDPMHNRTALGSIGKVKTSNRIVIRIEPKQGRAPTYLRETIYQNYRSASWSVGKARDFTGVPSDITETSWTLLPGSTNAPNRVSIGCYLEERSRLSMQPMGLLPLPLDSVLLENLPAFLLRRNEVGSVIAEGPGLLVFDAVFGGGRNADSPPDEDDLEVSRRERVAISEIVDKLDLRDRPRQEVMQRMQQFFQQECSYSTWQEAPRGAAAEMTPLSRFLLETRSGHCEFFATAAVLMLREANIPARYAVGYYVHETSGNGFVVRLRDAHAWTLVWNEETERWENFDTTPASWIAEESKRGTLRWLGDAWSWIKFQFSKVRWGQTNLRDYILIGLVPILGFLFYQIVRRRKRRRPQKTAKAEVPVWPGLDSEFYLIEKKLSARGLTRRSDETLTEWTDRALRDSDLATSDTPLQRLLRLHYQYRFDPRGLTPSEREDLRREASECVRRLARR